MGGLRISPRGWLHRLVHILGGPVNKDDKEEAAIIIGVILYVIVLISVVTMAISFS